MNVDAKTIALLGLVGGGAYVISQGASGTGSGGGSSGNQQQSGQQSGGSGGGVSDPDQTVSADDVSFENVLDAADQYFEENPEGVIEYDDPDGGSHTFVGEDSTSTETSDNVAGISDEYFEDWDAVEEDDSSDTDDDTNSWVDDAMDNPDANFL